MYTGFGSSSRICAAGSKLKQKDWFKTGWGVDMITDFDAIGSDRDTVDLSALSSIGNWKDLSRHHMEAVGTDVVIDGRNGDKIVLLNVDLADLGAGDFYF